MLRNKTIIDSVERETEGNFEFNLNLDRENLLLDLLKHFKDKIECDAGTVYQVEEDKCHFNSTFNNTFGMEPALAVSSQLRTNAIPLFHQDGTNNFDNICSFVIHNNTHINLEDVYAVNKFDFSGTKLFDHLNKYRTKSILTAPVNSSFQATPIGAVQLINAKKGYFTQEDEEYLLKILDYLKELI